MKTWAFQLSNAVSTIPLRPLEQKITTRIKKKVVWRLTFKRAKYTQEKTLAKTRIGSQFRYSKFNRIPLWDLWTIFLHESLLNLCASKASENFTWTLTEMCTHFFRMNLYWICAHLKLVKVQQNSLVKLVHKFLAWIFTEFVRI